MDRVGIAALADRLFPTLSGGEQQLVLIARAIAGGSRLLVLDEPSTGLDLKNQVRVLQLLRELVRTGMSLLVSTHHPDHALFLADSVVLMGAAGVVTGPAAAPRRCAAFRAVRRPCQHPELRRRRDAPPHHRGGLRTGVSERSGQRPHK